MLYTIMMLTLAGFVPHDLRQKPVVALRAQLLHYSFVLKHGQCLVLSSSISSGKKKLDSPSSSQTTYQIVNRREERDGSIRWQFRQ